MDVPDWNAEDPADSLGKWVEILKTESRKQFLCDGTHVEIVFVFGSDGLQNIVPIAGMEKDDIAESLRRFLSEHESYGYIHISEAVVRHCQTTDTVESLLLIAESRDGVSEVWVSAVVMKGDEKMLLDAVRVDGAKAPGRFTGLFK